MVLDDCFSSFCSSFSAWLCTPMLSLSPLCAIALASFPAANKDTQATTNSTANSVMVSHTHHIVTDVESTDFLSSQSTRNSRLQTPDWT
jgi:hypothetical protein